MATNSNHHFCPTTTSWAKFVSSLCKFHGTSSSISLRSSNGVASRRFSFSPMKKVRRLSCEGSTSSSGHNWNRTQKQNQFRSSKVVLNHRKEESFSDLGLMSGENGSSSSSSSTMEKIVEKLKKYGFVDDDEFQERRIEKRSMENRFYEEEERRGGFSEESPFDGFGGNGGEVKFPWEKVSSKETKELANGEWTAKKESRYSVAEMTLSEPELNRLRNVVFRTKSKMRVSGAGVTQAVVDAIQDKWKGSEIVKLKIEGSCALNMRRMHESLERKTGGLVIWRSGTSIALYNYKGDRNRNASGNINKQIFRRAETSPSSLLTSTSTVDHSVQQLHFPQIEKETTIEGNKDRTSQQDVEYEDEINELLEGLGPRYTDWMGGYPLPVDADLLPGFVPGYEPPFRVLPYGVRSTVGTKEATTLRRLATTLPPHFVLGRSRQLQGLATAMVALWQKSLIAKVALKRGVQLTTSERMAEDIKRLTGGMLLSRNKDFLVFYRGKSFLSLEVSEALLEKERLARSFQDEEEQARLRASSSLVVSSIKANQNLARTLQDEEKQARLRASSALVVVSKKKSNQNLVSAGTLGETLDATGKWGKNMDDDEYVEDMKQEVENVRTAKLVRKLERNLAFAEKKLLKAERALAKVERFLKPAEQRTDREGITEEERFMFQKLGLKMKAFLLLGKRGVFDGTVENMHLHWKYRELIKILIKAKNLEGAKNVAMALEAESGGILVSVDKISKGYAIIVYRGKDYKRPSTLRPTNLLTKRKALARSVELQRRETLIKHIEAVQARSEKLRAEIEQVGLAKEKGDEVLYNKLDMAYSSIDEETDEADEGDDVYLDTYEDDEEGEIEIHAKGSLSETDVGFDSDDELWYSGESDTEFDDESESESESSTTLEATSVDDFHLQP